MEQTFAFEPPAIVARLTGDELAALRRFAEIAGRRWKSILLMARERSNYAGTGLADADRPVVQSAINKLGPTAFRKLRLVSVHPYSVLLLYPEDVNEGGDQTFYDSVYAASVDKAIELAQLNAADANSALWGQSGDSSDKARRSIAREFRQLLVIAGHHADIGDGY